MLDQLTIKEFAIIEKLTIDFRDSFTVLTGETGAGKSIIIDAVSLLLGGRGNSEYIRHGKEKAFVEGVFSVDKEETLKKLEAEDLLEEDNQVIFSRELNTSGKNVCKINGRTVPLSLYKEMALGLVDIHGQHDYQKLMQSSKQFDLFDLYGKQELKEKKDQVESLYYQWMGVVKNLQNLKEHKEDLLKQRDFLQFQIHEIEEADLHIGEEEELASKLLKLSHGEKILKSLDKAKAYLFDVDEGKSCYDLLAKAVSAIRDLGKYDEELNKIYDLLEPVSYTLDEAGREMDHYLDTLDVNPALIDELQDRQYKIKSLCSKYGNNCEEILNKLEELKKEFASLEEISQSEEEYEKEIQRLEKEYMKAAEELSSVRRKIKEILENAVNGEIHDLRMADADFLVEMKETEASAKGLETIEFLISTNAGEPHLPLSKIASGGELSRITLGMKRVLAAFDSSDTLVFDEIDSGMGGETTYSVADKLRSIADDQQVICITHSAIIAAKADQHLYIEKMESEDRTKSSVEEISGSRRVGELARMLGGKPEDPDLRAHAEKLLSK